VSGDEQGPTGEARCEVAPPGWYCTRAASHDGPCAAWPTRTTRVRYALAGKKLPR